MKDISQRTGEILVRGIAVFQKPHCCPQGKGTRAEQWGLLTALPSIILPSPQSSLWPTRWRICCSFSITHLDSNWCTALCFTKTCLRGPFPGSTLQNRLSCRNSTVFVFTVFVTVLKRMCINLSIHHLTFISYLMRCITRGTWQSDHRRWGTQRQIGEACRPCQTAGDHSPNQWRTKGWLMRSTSSTACFHTIPHSPRSPYCEYLHHHPSLSSSVWLPARTEICEGTFVLSEDEDKESSRA